VAGYHTQLAACVRLLQQVGALCVAGNHDRAAIGVMTAPGFSPHAQRAIAWTQERLEEATRDFLAALPLKRAIDGALVAVHGALHPEVGCEWVRLDDDAKRALSFDALAAHPCGAQVCAFGHTHRPGVWERYAGGIRFVGRDTVTLAADALYLVNPGSVGESRDDDPRASFALFDSQARSIAFHRVMYDRSSVLAQTREAGLIAPQRLAWLGEDQRAQLKATLRRWRVYDFSLAVFDALDGRRARWERHGL
jgi:diadenosine tetraphosphatase ApaH/serine/threonine PP2A family protein phosphatase